MITLQPAVCCNKKRATARQKCNIIYLHHASIQQQSCPKHLDCPEPNSSFDHVNPASFLCLCHSYAYERGCSMFVLLLLEPRFLLPFLAPHFWVRLKCSCLRPTLLLLQTCCNCTYQRKQAGSEVCYEGPLLSSTCTTWHHPSRGKPASCLPLVH